MMYYFHVDLVYIRSRHEDPTNHRIGSWELNICSLQCKSIYIYDYELSEGVVLLRVNWIEWRKEWWFWEWSEWTGLSEGRSGVAEIELSGLVWGKDVRVIIHLTNSDSQISVAISLLKKGHLGVLITGNKVCIIYHKYLRTFDSIYEKTRKRN